MALGALALLCAIGGSPAAAQAPRLSEFIGSWEVDAGPHSETGCHIRGQADVRVVNGALQATLDLSDECPQDVVWSARESCRGEISNGALIVRCTVLHDSPDGYNADTFVFTQLSPQELTGYVDDSNAWRRQAARWRRTGPGNIS